MNYYNRRGGGMLANIPQVTKVVLIINVLVFLVDVVTGSEMIKYLFGAWSLESGNFRPYQIITHMFTHGDFYHILFNMFILYMFGRAIEMYLGGKKFFILYFASGLGAFGLQFLIYYLEGTVGLMIGASGAVMGVMVAFAVLYPNVELFFMFIPIPIKAKYMILGLVLFDLFSGVTKVNAEMNIAHFAHLGGALIGFILMKYWQQNRFRMM